jgi:hypothetical protein
MKSKLIGIMMAASLALVLSGCNPTANDNANNRANANTNANATPANTNTNTNANANSSTRRALTREEYEKNKQTYSEQAKSLGRKVGKGLDDGWLWTKARFDLAAADDLKDSTINVDVENGVVTLSGTVDNADQRSRAETIAKSVDGVKSVKNLLKTTASAKAKKGAPSK